MSWLKNALLQANKPKESIIGVLKERLGGSQPGRDRSVIHASDVTSPYFCPRKWAFFDLMEKKAEPQYIATALDVTFQMGLAAERLLVEDWAGDHIIGNWQCARCGESRTMVKKPSNQSQNGHKHEWKYCQVIVDGGMYGVSGGVDCLFDVGAPLLLITEVKTLNPNDFESILVPQPEHRLRTNLYMKLASESPYKDRINLHEAKVLYISRGYGKMNPNWNEILPFKEFDIKRDDEAIKQVLQRALAIKLFRENPERMPSGICSTALDTPAKNCSVCKECFSGQFPAKLQWESL